VRVLRRRWLQIFVSGLILLYLLELALVASSNPIYVPSILLGAFLVPVTFVEFFGVTMLSLLVAMVSLVLLIRRVREARRAGA